MTVLAPSNSRKRSVEHESPPRLHALHLGMGASSTGGGLDRYFHGLSHAMPAAGVSGVSVVVGTPNCGDRLQPDLRVACAETAPLPLRLKSLRQVVRQEFQRCKPDVVGAHFPLYALPVLRLLKDRPLVAHFHGPWAAESRCEGAGRLASAAKAYIERFVYRKCRFIITLSHAFADLLHQTHGIPRERIRIVPGGIDCDAFNGLPPRRSAREILGWPLTRPTILSVRRLVHRMGLEDLIDATREVRQRHPDVLLLIAGKGPLCDALQSRIEALGLSGNVKLLGFVPDDRLALTYRAADWSIVPSRSLEGFGLVAAESLAAGTPALVTPVGGLPEVVQGLEPRWILPGVGRDAIIETLNAALQGKIASACADSCEAHVRRRFDWSVVAPAVRDIYLQALT